MPNCRLTNYMSITYRTVSKPIALCSSRTVTATEPNLYDDDDDDDDDYYYKCRD